MENSQSSCKYARPFAEPRAILSLVGHSMVGLPFPEITQFESMTMTKSKSIQTTFFFFNKGQMIVKPTTINYP